LGIYQFHGLKIIWNLGYKKDRMGEDHKVEVEELVRLRVMEIEIFLSPQHSGKNHVPSNEIKSTCVIPQFLASMCILYASTDILYCNPHILSHSNDKRIQIG
jgi:hypothetical protein